MGVGNEKIFDYRQTSRPFPMDQGEYPSERETVGIRLRSARQIGLIINSLQQSLRDSDIEEQGNDIIVSGCPPDNTNFEETVLAIARKYDSGAVSIHPRR